MARWRRRSISLQSWYPESFRWDQKAKPGQMRKKFSQNINICNSMCIWFSLLCVDSFVSLWRKVMATLGLVPVWHLNTSPGKANVSSIPHGHTEGTPCQLCLHHLLLAHFGWQPCQRPAAPAEWSSSTGKRETDADTPQQPALHLASLHPWLPPVAGKHRPALPLAPSEPHSHWGPGGPSTEKAPWPGTCGAGKRVSGKRG